MLKSLKTNYDVAQHIMRIAKSRKFIQDRYQDDSGRKCAIGHCLTEGELERIEKSNAHTESITVIYENGLVEIPKGVSVKFLEAIQEENDIGEDEAVYRYLSGNPEDWSMS